MAPTVESMVIVSLPALPYTMTRPIDTPPLVTGNSPRLTPLIVTVMDAAVVPRRTTMASLPAVPPTNRAV